MRTRYIIIVSLYCLALFRVMSVEATAETYPAVPGLDKLVHAALYGALTALISVGMYRSDRDWSLLYLFFAPPLLAASYGAALEAYQYFLPYRSYDPWDIAANGVGAALTQLLLFTAMYLARKKRRVHMAAPVQAQKGMRAD